VKCARWSVQHEASVARAAQNNHDPGRPMTFTARSFGIRVPASTSNLGAGFDFVGMAVDRWLELSVSTTGADAPVVIRRTGTLAGLQCTNADDLIWRGAVAACNALGKPIPRGLEIDADSSIPVARGLGSSAAAVVAGVLMVGELYGSVLDRAAVVDIAASLEGHPDNAAPSVFGGAILSIQTSPHVYRSVELRIHPSLRFVFLVPDFEVRTSVARAALPVLVDFHTAVSAASRAAALVLGLQGGDSAILAPALDDVLHVPYRRQLVRGYDAVTEAALAAGAIGATLSGSGSTVVAVTTESTQNEVLEAATRAWESRGVVVDAFVTSAEKRGAEIIGKPSPAFSNNS
jgi:homoserine kinase